MIFASTGLAEEEVSSHSIGVLISRAQSDLEQLRQELGRPKIERLTKQVHHATYTDVYSSAYSLLEKCERLHHEQLRKHFSTVREVSFSSVTPVHTTEALHEVLKLTRKMEQNLGFENPREEQKVPQDLSLDTALMNLLEANRLAANLLQNSIAPSEVYQEISISFQLALYHRAQYPGKRIPPIPVFERKKIPEDVYRSLLKTFSSLSLDAKRRGEEVLQIDFYEGVPIVSGDALEVAKLLSAELRHVYGVEPEKIITYQPGVKSPSHNFQRISLVQAVLQDSLNASKLRKGSG